MRFNPWSFSYHPIGRGFNLSDGTINLAGIIPTQTIMSVPAEAKKYKLYIHALGNGNTGFVLGLYDNSDTSIGKVLQGGSIPNSWSVVNKDIDEVNGEFVSSPLWRGTLIYPLTTNTTIYPIQNPSESGKNMQIFCYDGGFKVDTSTQSADVEFETFKLPVINPGNIKGVEDEIDEAVDNINEDIDTLNGKINSLLSVTTSKYVSR